MTHIQLLLHIRYFCRSQPFVINFQVHIQEIKAAQKIIALKSEIPAEIYKEMINVTNWIIGPRLKEKGFVL